MPRPVEDNLQGSWYLQLPFGSVARCTKSCFSRFCFLFIALAACAFSTQAETCGPMRQGQYADEQLCSSLAVLPDGQQVPSAMEGVPETQPWLFPEAAVAQGPALTLKINAPGSPFTTLQILNGWAPDDGATAGQAVFESYGRVRELAIETSDGRNQSFTLQDSPEHQFITFDTAAEAEWVKATIQSTYAGKKGIAALRSLSVAWEADQ